MYVPQHFAEDRPQVLQALMRSHPFATLVHMTSDGLVANHLPLVFDASDAGGTSGTLAGHIARANPLRAGLWRDANTGLEALAIFHGPHAYVSPSWYPSKQGNDGKVVPTWNYAIVQARGTLRLIDDPAWLLTHISAQTDAREASRAERWRVSDAPREYIETLVRNIVGVELSVRTLTGKWKLSQNRSDEDRAGVIEGLSQSGSDMLAAMMRTDQAN